MPETEKISPIKAGMKDPGMLDHLTGVLGSEEHCPGTAVADLSSATAVAVEISPVFATSADNPSFYPASTSSNPPACAVSRVPGYSIPLLAVHVLTPLPH